MENTCFAHVETKTQVFIQKTLAKMSLLKFWLNVDGIGAYVFFNSRLPQN
jgi:hypothetical protein